MDMHNNLLVEMILNLLGDVQQQQQCQILITTMEKHQENRVLA